MGDFDPFAEQLVQEDAMSDMQCLTHMLKSALASGILSMPYGFMYTGLALGVISLFVAATIVGHCNYMLIKCAHRMYHLEKRNKMTFAEVAETVFARGPGWAQKISLLMKTLVQVFLFLTYFGTCIVYIIIIAKNLQLVVSHWAGESLTLNFIIISTVIPVVLLVWIPNLKLLAPFSLVANILVGIILIISCYYCFRDSPSISDRKMFDFKLLPQFFAISVYAIECVGAIMPLENNMRNPQHILGACGVLNQGMIGITVVNMIFGFVGYLGYGDNIEETITLNFPVDERLAQCVNLCFAVSLYLTIGIQFAIVLDTIWNAIHTILNDSIFFNYILRTVLILLAFVIAIAVPSIVAFMELIGAFCFAFVGIVVPALMDSVMEFENSPETRFGKFKWVLWKNLIVVCCGLFTLVLGTKSSLADIAKIYED